MNVILLPSLAYCNVISSWIAKICPPFTPSHDPSHRVMHLYTLAEQLNGTTTTTTTKKEKKNVRSLYWSWSKIGNILSIIMLCMLIKDYLKIRIPLRLYLIEEAISSALATVVQAYPAPPLTPSSNTIRAACWCFIWNPCTQRINTRRGVLWYGVNKVQLHHPPLHNILMLQPSRIPYKWNPLREKFDSSINRWPNRSPLLSDKLAGCSICAFACSRLERTFWKCPPEWIVDGDGEWSPMNRNLVYERHRR